MADELAHFSVLDDESSTSYFLNWAGNFGGGATLRGGDRVDSNTLPDAQIDVENAAANLPAIPTQHVVPLVDHEISKVGSRTTPARASTSKPVQPPPPTPAHVSLPPHGLPRNIPTTPQNTQETEPVDSRTLGASPVTSVAHRKSAYHNKYPSPKPAVVNKLDETPTTKPMTPTQQRLLEKTELGEQKTPSTYSIPVTQPKLESPRNERTETARAERFQNANTATSTPGGENVSSGIPYNAMEKQFFSSQASTGLNPSADEFYSRNADHVEPKASDIVLPEGGADAPSDDETADARSEGGMDLTPVLKALGARPTISTSVTTTASEVSAMDIEPAQANPSRAARDEVLPVPADRQAAEGGATPTMRAQDLDLKAKSNLTANPTEEEDIEKTQTESRTIVLKNLPDDSDHTFVQSLIYGAVVESMILCPENHTAMVKVTNVEDCQGYIDSCPSGIKVKHNRAAHTVLVEKSKEPDYVDDKLQAYLDCGATRVVKVEDADEEMTMKALYKFAEGPSQSREVESIMDACRRGIRNIVFRFSGIHDAVAFRSALLRDRSWRSKNPHFAEDPCELATGPRSE
ncbi:hypothetical protein PMZ80_002977 [Knufia obscura]|uniref:RRM domain-containing protein n=1 Tax=Knufia obscura TaxID=1635080 RepID=A0ABR0RZT2_9EURO|nr:hypothetical protein PMZ80_002977 [Knufia obscura]